MSSSALPMREFEVLAMFAREVRFLQLPTHCGEVLLREAERLQIRQAPPHFAEARIEFQALAIGGDGAVLVTGRFQCMAVTHPDLRVPGIFVEDARIDRDRRIVVADPAQHHGLQVAIAGIGRVDGQQGFDFRQGLHRLVAAMQDQRVVLARGVEARCEFQATREQVLGILVAAQARGDFGEHADRGHVGRRPLQLFAQQYFRIRDAVFVQRGGSSEQARVARGKADVACISGVGAFAVAGRHEVVAEREPGFRQVGLERDRAPQRGAGFVAAFGACQRDAELEVGHGRMGLRERERRQDFEGAPDLAARAMRCAEQQQGHGVVADGLDDLRSLLAGERRIGREQARGMGQGRFEIGGGLGRETHCTTPLNPMP